MQIYPTPLPNTRLGFHYYPDTLHYRERDLHTWLPELRAVGVSWLTLVAPAARAIPEAFLRGLIEHQIEPVVHFPLTMSELPPLEELTPLLRAYSRWGVHYVCLLDRPNRRAAWPSHSWTQTDLVERFLDIYLPYAEAILRSGLIPVFPPLEPGGDYWDTAFLRTALKAMLRRGHTRLLGRIVLAAYAWADDHPLNWGAGGPERWPGAQPYRTPKGEEDQRGFRIFDWYQAIARAVLGKPRPILVLRGGTRKKGGGSDEKNLTIARLMRGESLAGYEPVPPEVLTCNLWLLTAAPNSPHLPEVFYRPDGEPLPLVSHLRPQSAVPPPGKNISPTFSPPQLRRPIRHYLLLPSYEWGVADWHLEAIHEFVKKHKPTIGFSIKEARHAARVTVIGCAQFFSEEELASLQDAGCEVVRVDGDGTRIATQLAAM